MRSAYSAAKVQEAEHACEPELSDGTLMQRAATAVADHVRWALSSRSHSGAVVGLIGPGNNGADTLYALAQLAEVVPAIAVTVTASVHEEALAAALAAEVEHIDAATDPDSAEDALAAAVCVLDGILGIGADPWRTAPGSALAHHISPRAHVVAVDVPSPGMSADSTITFQVRKPVHLLSPERCGHVSVVSIGLDMEQIAPTVVAYDDIDLARLWPVPDEFDHKYSRGVVGMLAGSPEYPGAGVLAALGALGAGAGMVRYAGGVPDAVIAAAPEVVLADGPVDVWVMGCGLPVPKAGEKEDAVNQRALEVLNQEVPAVLDAGALRWITRDVLHQREGCTTVLTPHLGEFVGLMNRLYEGELPTSKGPLTTAMVRADPSFWLNEATKRMHAMIVLKGFPTIIADANHAQLEIPLLVDATGPAWLATAGSGDVLAGLIGTLMAAGGDPKIAVAQAVRAHSRAGRVANPGGPIRARNLADAAPQAITEILQTLNMSK